jgi:outer membrane scaffolding protein for murein synthesis (MipA/OmpV family)
LKTFFAFPILAALGGTAVAADLAPPAPEPLAPAPGTWLVTVGAGPAVIPSFPGAKTYTVVPVGRIKWRRPGEPEPFFAPDDAASIDILDFGWFKAGPAFGFVPRRGLSNGNGNFAGLHNVPLTIEGGAFVEFWPASFLRARLEVRQGFNGHRGLVGNVAVDGIYRIGQFTASLGPRIALGNTRYMNAYYTVTPAESLANGIVPPFQSYGGIRSLGVFAAVKYDFTPNWSLTVFGGYDRLVNGAGESPIPNQLGSKNQFKAGTILAYTFSFDGFGFFRP